MEAMSEEEKMRAEVADEKEPFLDIVRTIQMLKADEEKMRA